MGTAEWVSAVRRLRRWKRNGELAALPLPWTQFVLWLALLTACPILLALHFFGAALLSLLFAQLFPRFARDRTLSRREKTG
jgi:hypothetical protein